MMADFSGEQPKAVTTALAANAGLFVVMLACALAGAAPSVTAVLQSLSPWVAATALWLAANALDDPASRRAWRWLAGSQFVWAVGDACWLWIEVVARRSPFPSVADVFYVLQFVPALIALAAMRQAPPTGSARVRRTVDGAIMTISGFLLVGVVYVYPSLNGAAGNQMPTVLGLLYPLLDLLLIQSALLLLVQPARPGEPRLAMMALAAATLCQGAADMVFAQGEASMQAQWVRAATVIYPLAQTLFIAAAWWRLRGPSRSEAEPPAFAWFELLPYAFVCLAMAALALAPHLAPELAGGVAAAGVVVVVSLVALRQGLSAAEERRLREATDREMGRRSRAMVQLLARDQLLGVVAEFAERLLTGRRWIDRVDSLLAELGAACAVSRVHLMPVSTSEAQPGWTWSRSPGAELDRAMAADFLVWWQARLLAGESVCGRLAEFPAEQRAQLSAHGIRAMALVPVFVADELWGCLGFDDLMADREFSRAELDALKAAANVLGAAISREAAIDQLQASEAWNRTIFEQVPAGIVVIDAETHTIADANPVALAMFGAEASRIVGQVCHRFICPSAQGRCPVTDLGQAVDAAERTVLTAAGLSVPVVKTVVPVELEGRRYLVESFFDNTARKQAEAALHRSQETLEAAVADRTRELQQAYEDLRVTQSQVIAQERLRALGTMASGIAHDINNALSPVMGFAEIMLTDGVLDDRARVRRYLGLILKGAHEASDVVRRLRELYRQRPDGEEAGMVDPVEAFRHAIALAQPRWRDQALAAGITIEVVTEFVPVEPLPAHAAELHEALLNLLLNATDAIESRGGPTGRIVAGCRRVGNEVRLSVGDDGVGMDAAAQRLCFEPLYSTKDEPGCGLGLVAVLTIVRRHAGAIDVMSQPGQGTTVVLRLPYHADAAPDVVSRASAGPAGGSLRVLVADDEPDLRDLLSEFLQYDGHSVVLAPNGRVALEAFASESFDLVITDRAMPVVNGDQLARAVKEQSPATPVLMLTGFGALMDAGGEQPLGVDRVLGKPFTLEELRGAVSGVMDGQPVS